jgi:hypothetical protein
MIGLILTIMPTTVCAAYIYWRAGQLPCWPILVAVIVGLWGGTDLGARLANHMDRVAPLPECWHAGFSSGWDSRCTGMESSFAPAPAPAAPVPSYRRGIWMVAVAAWIAAIAWGADVVRRYESTPGEAAVAPRLWPTGSLITRKPDGPLLVMMVHPQCSCTLASLDELNVIMNRMHGRAAATVVFVRSDDLEGGVESMASWSQARRIPGVSVINDHTGVEAARFGALTSGQVVVYGRDGRLTFAGGITGSRGHEGDNLGRRQVLAALEDSGDPRASHAVYGCPL